MPSQPGIKGDSIIIVLSTNCDSFLNKKDELLILAEDTQADLILVTEVRPKNFRVNPSELEFTLDGYRIYSNLESTSGRGVAFYVNDSKSHLVTAAEVDNSFQEHIWDKPQL